MEKSEAVAPRPWTYDLESGWVEDANEDPIEHLDDAAIAALIVRAVNAHDALVAALREFVAAFDDPTTTDAQRNVLVEVGLDSWIHEAHAALAKAEGGQP